MRGRYLGLIFGGLVAVSNICYASIPKYDNKPKLEEIAGNISGNIETDDIKAYIKENEAIRKLENGVDMLKKAMELLSSEHNKWYNFGTVYAGDTLKIKSKEIFGIEAISVKAFSTLSFKVKEGGIIEAKPTWCDATLGSESTVIELRYKLNDGREGKLFLEGRIEEKGN